MIRLFWKLLGWEYRSITLCKMVYSVKTDQLEPSSLRVRYWAEIGDVDTDSTFKERIAAFKADGWEERS